MNDRGDATPAEPSIRERLLVAHRSGSLLEGIIETLRIAAIQEESVAHELAVLHNDGTIDLADVFSELRKREDGLAFFRARSVFDRALPLIDADVKPVIRTVRHLVHEAGKDLAAGSTLDSLVVFLAKEPTRPKVALSAIKAEPELHELLPAGLLAGCRVDMPAYVQEALLITNATNADMRRQAVFALGRIGWSDENKPPEAICAAFERLLGAEAGDSMLAAIADAAARVLVHDPARADRLIGLIDGAVEKGDAQALHAAASILAGASTPDVLVQRLLTHIRRVNPEQKGTVDRIDHALSTLMLRGRVSVALEALGELIVKGALEPDAFASVIHVIRNDAALLRRVVTKWLLDGSAPLCRMAATLVGDGDAMDLPCEVDATEIDTADGSGAVFLARKVCGYFFMNPVSAASMLLSLMELTLDGHTRKRIGRLILNPLLINYPGKARSFFIDRLATCSTETQAELREIDAALEEYLSALRSISSLPELFPSEVHREAFHRYQNRKVQEAYREAEKRSALRRLITKQVVLYGHTTISYFKDGHGKAHRQEVPLQEHVVTIEPPRMAQLDSLGLEYQLAVFRTEKRAE